MKLASVEWLDASYQEGPLGEDDFEPRVVLVSAGLLAREDDETITVAADYDARADEWRHVNHIRKVNVIRNYIGGRREGSPRGLPNLKWIGSCFITPPARTRAI
jgi:hypothetical protein